jgi:hypothetical protein
MMRQDKAEFRQLIQAAIWNWLDRLAERIDRQYACLGIKKQERTAIECEMKQKRVKKWRDRRQPGSNR